MGHLLGHSLAIRLKYLAIEETLLGLSCQFQMTHNMVAEFIHRVCEELTADLASQVISMTVALERPSLTLLGRGTSLTALVLLMGNTDQVF